MNESTPGPGWEKGKDGRWHPDWLTYANFRGAAALSAFFKVFAVIVVGAGVIAAILIGRSLHADGAGGNTAAVVVGIIGGSVVAASAVAFFGFVLELLIAIHFGVRFSDSAREAARLDQVST